MHEKEFNYPQRYQGQAFAWIPSENELSAGKEYFKAATPKRKKKTLSLKFIRRLIVIGLDFYQRCISVVLPSSCRFSPSCSEYCKQAIVKYGLIKGTAITLMRLAKCHPLSGRQGFDPLR